MGDTATSIKSSEFRYRDGLQFHEINQGILTQ